MTDESAFLRAVCDAPEDDLPRLVYADWLDEHADESACVRCEGGKVGKDSGPPCHDCPDCGGTGRVPDGRRERGEFIRVQCELARLPSGPLYIDPEDAGDRDALRRGEALRRRERELIQSESVFWGADLPFPAHPDRGFCVWRRGFVESVTCPARTFLKHCHDIRNACPLREATLAGDVDPDWFRVRAMREGGRREGIRLCEGGFKLGIVAAAYDAYRGRRYEWGRKLFLDLLHAEFRGVSFRLAEWVTVQDRQVRGGSVFPAGRDETEQVRQFVRENPSDFGVNPDGREWVSHDDRSAGRGRMDVICGCSVAPPTSSPGEVNRWWQVELRMKSVIIEELVYTFLIGRCDKCNSIHWTTPTRQYAPTSPAYR